MNKQSIFDAYEAFTLANGNKTLAAKALGISRRTLSRRLEAGSWFVTELKTKKIIHESDIVLVISDLHCPFHHKDALDFLVAVEDKYNTTRTVCIGDEVDAHALSDFKTNPDGMGPGQEHNAAVDALRTFYNEFPVVDVLISNHTARPYRAAFNANIPKSYLKGYKEIYDAPDGWNWYQELEIDGVWYNHGMGFGGEHAHVTAAKKKMQSAVIGHVHANAGVRIVNGKRNIFGLNVGCLVDEAAYAFDYAKDMPTSVTVGCGIVFHGEVAQFIPMLTDSNGRWTGDLL